MTNVQKYDKNINVRVTREQAEQLRAVADRLKVSVSDVARIALAAGLPRVAELAEPVTDDEKVG